MIQNRKSAHASTHISSNRRRRLRMESLEMRRVLASLVVTTPSDVVDANDGLVSLREAISTANENTDVDEITFDASVFSGATTIALTRGVLPITSGLNITGPGRHRLAIDAQSASRVFDIDVRVFEVGAQANQVSIEGLTITGGRSFGFNENGGAIRQSGATELVLDGVALINNQTSATNANGGAISSAGKLTIRNSVVAGNGTTQVDAGGGAINSTGMLTIVDSQIFDNFTSGTISAGGAIRSTGNLTIQRSTLEQNITSGSNAAGGAIFATGRLTIESSRLIGNQTRGINADGGAVLVFQAVDTLAGGFEITDSDIDDNRTLGNGSRGGGLYIDLSSGSISATSITNNQTVGEDADGGGMMTFRTDITIDQVTLSGNVAGGSGSVGGAIVAEDTRMTANGITVSRNTANENGGGIHFLAGRETDSLSLIHAIVAGNQVTNDMATASPDLNFSQTPPSLAIQSSLIGSSIGNPLDPASAPDADGNLVGGATEATRLDPGLDDLIIAGSTRIHPFVTDSIAIDAGNSVLSPETLFDQRGLLFDRVSGLQIDIGGAEQQAIDATSFVVTTLIDELDLTNDDVSLREAILASNQQPGLQTISFREGLGSASDAITLASGQLLITDSVIITGPGRSQMSIDAVGLSRAMEIIGNSDVTIQGVTIRGGRTIDANSVSTNFGGEVSTRFNGAGIRSVSTGTVTLRDVAVVDSETAGENSTGGAVWAESGTLVVEDSVIDQNRGGGIGVRQNPLTLDRVTVSQNLGAGIDVDRSAAFFINTTVSGNSGQDGGGIRLIGTSPMSIVQSTIVGNAAAVGGGVFIGADVVDDISIVNSIIAQNSATDSNPDLSLPTVSGAVTISFSLIGDNADTGLAESITPDANGNLIGDASVDGVIDPRVAPLAVSGPGGMLVHALDALSPAIDAGSDAFSLDALGNPLDLDARGLPFVRFNSTVDMGAFEFQKATPIIVWNDPAVIFAGTPLSDLQLNATTNIPGTFVYTPAIDTVLDAGDDQTLMVTFTPDDTDLYNEATAEVMIDVAQPFDRGDAPDTYGTLAASSGPTHQVTTLLLGSTIDRDVDGQPTLAADGDGADEDGVLFAAPLIASANGTVSSIVVIASEAGKLDAWIDFDGNGSFDIATESIVGGSSFDVQPGENVIPFAVPAAAVAGNTYARFRLSTTGGLGPTGDAGDGEVEDYAVSILSDSTPSDVDVTVTGSQITLVRDGEQVVVRRRNVEVFRAEIAAVNQLTINGDEFSNVLTIDQSGGDAIPVGGLVFDGGDRVNTVRWVGAAGDLDFTPTGNLVFRNVNAIDLTDTSAQSVLIDSAAAQQMDPDGGGIIITTSPPVENEPSDVVTIADAEFWRMGQPASVVGDLFSVITRSDTFIQTDFGNGWQNLANVSDVNNSGTVTANDALVVINELGRRAYSNRNGGALVDPATVDPWPGFYFDQNGDGLATALDALRVINQLARQANAGSGSAEAESLVAIDPFDDKRTGRNIDELIADESFLATLF
ncbi:hypothetical protein Poly51_10420 [Rubripirellula tenax]|uniref:Uncharacterized protein n=1 Tax=Rubripirellula tenax TaxID=2528015 RepID=A0A5C6FGX7_9BACT|nr:choice-of-anchor Q domain-containing protein [Rubripirellula tenax]TWU60761.1 hypothetical protein Poly51_10420 [Rubripirellula tenax]